MEDGERDSLIPLQEKAHKSAKISAPPKKKTSHWNFKIISFVVIGVLTLAYCVAELGIAIWISSLSLLSDGFHNLSDVVSLYIAFWATRAAKRETSDAMSYGWVRAEILGGLTNGCFLLSLCLYVALEAISQFIDPQSKENLQVGDGWPFIGVAAGGLIVNTVGTLTFAATGISHGHSHGGEHGHGGHGHSHGKKKYTHHSEEDEDEGDELLPHKHEEIHCDVKPPKKKLRIKLDLNMWGVFIHYLGDMLSSAVVLVTGIMLKYLSGTWTDYIDPAASLIIVALILWTTIPLVRECSLILLQRTPAHVELSSIRAELLALQGVQSIHDLHVWLLAEGKAVGSVHVSVEEGMDFPVFLKMIKSIFHKHGIHSTTVQPEFVPKNYPPRTFCEENCVKNCEEDWCCKITADKLKSTKEQNNHEKEKEHDIEAGLHHHHHDKPKHKRKHKSKHKHKHKHEHEHEHDDVGDNHDHDHDADDQHNGGSSSSRTNTGDQQEFIIN